MYDEWIISVVWTVIDCMSIGFLWRKSVKCKVVSKEVSLAPFFCLFDRM